MSIYDVFSGGNRPFNKEEWAAQKQAQRQEAYDLIDSTCSEMAAGGESFRQYLEVQGRFDRYSVANAVLVSAQMPEATQLKDYNSWKQSRVYVNKNADKVTILEPSKEYTRDDGTKAVSYNAKAVYDISQTSAKDRQQPQEQKTMRELVSALIDASPVPFQPCLLYTSGKSIMEELTTEERISEICNIQSISAAIQNMLLAATEKGIGSLWICDIYFAYPEPVSYTHLDVYKRQPLSRWGGC